MLPEKETAAFVFDRCPVLLISGQRSLFNGTTRALHQSILRSCKDKTKVEFIEIAGVANVLQEKVSKKKLSRLL
jgi:protein NDRG1